MINPKKVSACLVTRGNVPMDEVVDSLPYGQIRTWDNSKYVDMKVFGRYCAAADFARYDTIYFQDDDVLFYEHDKLMSAYEPDMLVANNAHGPNHGGYNDMALLAAGSLVTKRMIDETWRKWFDVHPGPPDDGVLYEADFIFGILVQKWKQIDLPYQRLYADDDTRLCRQPWQEDLKLKYTNMAREIRDGRYSDQ